MQDVISVLKVFLSIQKVTCCLPQWISGRFVQEGANIICFMQGILPTLYHLCAWKIPVTIPSKQTDGCKVDKRGGAMDAVFVFSTKDEPPRLFQAART